MLRIGIDGYVHKKWRKVKGLDILTIRCEDGEEYELVLTPAKKPDTEDSNGAA